MHRRTYSLTSLHSGASEADILIGRNSRVCRVVACSGVNTVKCASHFTRRTMRNSLHEDICLRTPFPALEASEFIIADATGVLVEKNSSKAQLLHLQLRPPLTL